MPLAPTRLAAVAAVALCTCALPATASAKKSASPKLPKTFMKKYHVKSAVADPDRDGLTNFTEYRAHTNPKKKDSDHDGVVDGSEDWDHDGLDDATEQRAGTNPGLKDTNHNGRVDAREDADHDGLNNLAEQNTANDPGDPDSDDDGVRDGAEGAGQVVAFDGSVLTLRLASSGKVVKAGVDDATAVECNGTDDYEASYDDGAADDTNAADDGGDDSFSDDSGDGSGSDDSSADDGSSDDSGDDSSGDDDPSASDARFVRSQDAADDGSDDSSDDSGDDPADVDTSADGGLCTDVLDAGAWVHASSVSTDDDGAAEFDEVALVDDGE
jgi:hypothetical protein